jgi:hypothetical protein
VEPPLRALQIKELLTFTLGEKKANSQAEDSHDARLLNNKVKFKHLESIRKAKTFCSGVQPRAPRTRLSQQSTIARAADSLPAAAEPVWYPNHAGSRRADSRPILLFSPRVTW